MPTSQPILFSPQFCSVVFRSVETLNRRSGPHRAAHDLLMVFTEANLMMSVDSRMLSLVDGCAVLVPAGSRYVFSHGSRCRFYCLSFTLEPDGAGSTLAASMLHKLPSLVRLRTPDDRESVCRQMEQLYRHFQKPQWLPDAFSALYAAASFTKLLLDVYALQATASDSSSPDPHGCLVLQMTSYLDEHFREPITLDHLEKTFFLSRFHLCRLFREQTRMTIFEYIHRKKVQVASELLLSTERDITAICFDSGFGNMQSFYTAFRRHTGKTPLQFRKARHNTP